MQDYFFYFTAFVLLCIKLILCCWLIIIKQAVVFALGSEVLNSAILLSLPSTSPPPPSDEVIDSSSVDDDDFTMQKLRDGKNLNIGTGKTTVPTARAFTAGSRRLSRGVRRQHATRQAALERAQGGTFTYSGSSQLQYVECCTLQGNEAGTRHFYG